MMLFNLLIVFYGCLVLTRSEDPATDDSTSTDTGKVSRCWNTLTGEGYREAETWAEGPCKKCRCMKGGPECVELACDDGCKEGYELISEDGECCPTCEPVPPPEGCIVGESWNKDPCTFCNCVQDDSGRKIAICDQIYCDMPQCEHGYLYLKEHCCPGCRDICQDPYTGASIYPDSDVTFYSDYMNCTECSCVLDADGKKRESCYTAECDVSDTTCLKWDTPSGSCCPVCVEEEDPCAVVKCAALVDSEWCRYGSYLPEGECCSVCKDPCYNPNTGEVVPVGDSYRPDPCSSCECMLYDGELDEVCAVQDCGWDETCVVWEQEKDTCCPTCVSWKEDCSLVDCPAPPYCPYTHPITLDGHCCESCAPDYCATVDCVVPECDDLIYTAANTCCGQCRSPVVEACPDGTARLECGDGGVCDTETCTNFPAAECRPDVCNECEPVFYDVNGDTISQCTGECPSGQVFRICGSHCTPTCGDPLPTCNKMCVQRCQCPASTPYLYKGTCIASEDCPVDALPYCDEVSPNGEETSGSSGSAVESMMADAQSSEDSDIGASVGIACPDGTSIVNCFADPCQMIECRNFPDAKCVSNYCGGCEAVFYDANGDVIDQDSCGHDEMCPGTQEFANCGSACTSTCSNPNPICTEQCVQRCQCPVTAPILHKNTCIPLDRCPGSSTTKGGIRCRTRDTYPPNPPNPPRCLPDSCDQDPCEGATCENYPLAKCEVDYCTCTALFTDSNGDPLGDCQGECSGNKVHEECGTACPLTCSTPDDTACVAVCVPGCTCPRDTPILYRGWCYDTKDQCYLGLEKSDAGSVKGDSGAVPQFTVTTVLVVLATLYFTVAA